jgi:hypothetical protein
MPKNDDAPTNNQPMKQDKTSYKLPFELKEDLGRSIVGLTSSLFSSVKFPTSSFFKPVNTISPESMASAEKTDPFCGPYN